MRIFGSERMDSMLVRLGLEEGEAITHPWINKALEKAQMKVEARNFDIRKNLLKYDDVMNDQRKAIYEQRRELMEAEDVSETIADMREDTVLQVLHQHIPPRSFPEQWDTEGLRVEFHRVFNFEPPIAEWLQEDGISEVEIGERLQKLVDAFMAERAERFGPKAMNWLEKNMLLQTAAIEIARRRPLAVIAALQPGTVRSALSQPFVGEQALEPFDSAGRLLRVLDTLEPSGRAQFVDHAGQAIPW